MVLSRCWRAWSVSWVFIWTMGLAGSSVFLLGVFLRTSGRSRVRCASMRAMVSSEASSRSLICLTRLLWKTQVTLRRRQYLRMWTARSTRRSTCCGGKAVRSSWSSLATMSSAVSMSKSGWYILSLAPRSVNSCCPAFSRNSLCVAWTRLSMSALTWPARSACLFSSLPIVTSTLPLSWGVSVYRSPSRASSCLSCIRSTLLLVRSSSSLFFLLRFQSRVLMRSSSTSYFLGSGKCTSFSRFPKRSRSDRQLTCCLLSWLAFWRAFSIWLSVFEVSCCSVTVSSSLYSCLTEFTAPSVKLLFSSANLFFRISSLNSLKLAICDLINSLPPLSYQPLFLPAFIKIHIFNYFPPLMPLNNQIPHRFSAFFHFYNLTMSDQEDLLYIDDTQYINDITSKLAKIRETLGIEENQNDNPQPHSTFAKNEDTPNQPHIFSTPSHQAPQEDNPSQLQNQISFLQNKLDALKQIYPQSPSVDNDQRIDKENTYLKLELELKTKQERYLKYQLQEVEEKLGLEIQVLRSELESVKQGHDNFVQSSDLQSDLKSYILSLETDLNMTRQELMLYTQRLSAAEEANELLKKDLQNVENRVMKELDECYRKELNEMHYICKSLSCELLRPENLKEKHEIQGKLQEALDQNLILEQKLEELESHSKFGKEATLKTIYSRRLHNMKCGLLHWKTKSEKIEEIVVQWFAKIRDELERMKKELVRTQTKQFKVFEGLIREVYESFKAEKENLVSDIERLQKEKQKDWMKLTQLRVKQKKK